MYPLTIRRIPRDEYFVKLTYMKDQNIENNVIDELKDLIIIESGWITELDTIIIIYFLVL